MGPAMPACTYKKGRYATSQFFNIVIITFLTANHYAPAVLLARLKAKGANNVAAAFLI
jgi:hypothetical protein